MSAAKAFLCSQDGTYNFPLTLKITTVGREKCDIIINVKKEINFFVFGIRIYLKLTLYF